MRVKGRSPGFCPGSRPPPRNISAPAARYTPAAPSVSVARPASCAAYTRHSPPPDHALRAPPVAAGVAAPTGGCAAAPPAAG